jgi:hypothetical protein
VQGVSYEINGVLGTLLRFGSISIEKISTGSSFTLDFVRKPRKVEAAILKNMESYLHTKNMKDASQIQDLLASLVAEKIQHDDLVSVED